MEHQTESLTPAALLATCLTRTVRTVRLGIFWVARNICPFQVPSMSCLVDTLTQRQILDLLILITLFAGIQFDIDTATSIRTYSMVSVNLVLFLLGSVSSVWGFTVLPRVPTRTHLIKVRNEIARMVGTYTSLCDSNIFFSIYH